jgi:hypothetical protein
MRGPHSKHWLAIQLSKTELHRSNRASLIRTLATAGSRRRPCWFKSGAVSTLGAPCCQEGTSKKTSSPFRPKVPAFYTGPSFPSSGPARFHSLFCFEGAASIPTPGSPSRGRSGCPFRPLARGALCSPSEESRQGEHRLRCDSALQPLPTGALCSRDSIPCQAGGADRHEPHGATSRRHWAAALSARWSGRPASRSRAAATISSSRSRATSTSSFSRTYS